MQLQRHADEFQQKQVEIAVVTFEQPWLAQAYVDETDLSWPMLLDPDRELYVAYGMERGSAGEILSWRSWWIYLKLMLIGRRPQRATDDIYQLGGDVLIDPQGIIRLHHVGRGPADRPSIDAILAAVDRS